MNNELNTSNETKPVTNEVPVQGVQATPTPTVNPAPVASETSYTNEALSQKKTIFSPIVIVALIALVGYIIYFFLNM